MVKHGNHPETRWNWDKQDLFGGHILSMSPRKESKLFWWSQQIAGVPPFCLVKLTPVGHMLCARVFLKGVGENRAVALPLWVTTWWLTLKMVASQLGVRTFAPSCNKWDCPSQPGQPRSLLTGESRPVPKHQKDCLKGWICLLISSRNKTITMQNSVHVFGLLSQSFSLPIPICRAASPCQDTVIAAAATWVRARAVSWPLVWAAAAPWRKSSSWWRRPQPPPARRRLSALPMRPPRSSCPAWCC